MPPSSPTPPTCPYDRAHLASTYSALITLLACGDDLSRVDRTSLLRHLPRMQRPDGSFLSSPIADDADLRFTYCAMAIATLLDPSFTTHPPPYVDAAVGYVLACQTYEGGFGLQPHAEAHGAGTYVAVAALTLTGQLHRLGEGGRRRLERWAMARQGVEGYTGRANKPPDSCYAFWVGGTLRLLGLDGYTEVGVNCGHLARCGDGKRGGFGKEEKQRGDLLHSYMATAGLGLMQAVVRERREVGEEVVEVEEGSSPLWAYPVTPVCVALGVAVDHLPPAIVDAGFR